MIEHQTHNLASLMEAGRTVESVQALNDYAWDIRRKDLSSAYQAALLSEEIAVELNYDQGRCEALKVQGYCLWRFSDYSSSMDKSTQALALAEASGNKKDEADILNNIGAVYMFLNDNENRLKCNLKCLDIRREIKDFEGVSGSLNNIGETYMEMGNYEKARDYLYQCLNYEHTIVDSKGWAYHNLGLLEYKRKEYEKSIGYLNKSIGETVQSEYFILTSNSFYYLAINERDRGNYDAAYEYLHEALVLAKKMNAKEEIQNIHKVLAEVNELQNNIPKAYENFKIYSEVHNQVYNEENSRIIRNLKFQYELESVKKEAEIERLRNIELKKALKEIEHKNTQILSSIFYAKRIQEAILPQDKLVKAYLENSFILYYPKDIVSGDFYWMENTADNVLFAVVDCTGHGVPGAFMSIVGNNGLNKAVREMGIETPSKILDALNEHVLSSLRLEGTGVKDGMDIALCSIDMDKKVLEYAGAYNPLYLVRKGELIQIKPDKQAIGDAKALYTNHVVQLEEGDSIFIFSDGYADQFGGTKGKKFKYAKFKELLTSIAKYPVEMQKKLLQEEFKSWKGDLEQVDDVCLIGLTV